MDCASTSDHVQRSKDSTATATTKLVENQHLYIANTTNRTEEGPGSKNGSNAPLSELLQFWSWYLPCCFFIYPTSLCMLLVEREWEQQSSKGCLDDNNSRTLSVFIVYTVFSCHQRWWSAVTTSKQHGVTRNVVYRFGHILWYWSATTVRIQYVAQT